MAAAVHLTAARLSGEHPEIDYRRTKTWLMRSYGKHRSGQQVNARFLWDGTPEICDATRLHINRDWQLNSQPTTVLGPLDTVRLQRGSEPSVHGAKKTKPA
ncbi:hypothetical protein [Candidatus Poriferisodalis sp.]|uniref:hypothetical protein n=1 Tax=Candidatus Poriferisodalis sp. TaxID=3101277 RepID=UPI003B51EFF4